MRIEAGAANQRAIDFPLTHKASYIVGLDTTAIQDADVFSRIAPEAFLGFRADTPMRFGGDFGRGGLASPDCPDWLIGYYDLCKLFFGQSGDPAGKLPNENLVGPAALMLL